ncbi:MAG: Endoribonuclease [Phenylobacterium sp.]|nr:Endoribonuclease [Phenylobacterium sp.]
MRKLILAALLAGGLVPAAAQAQNLHIGPATAPIAQAVAVPAGSDMLYVSGITPPPLNAGAPAGTAPAYGDTKAQVTGILARINAALTAQGYTFGDVVMMRVYLVGDPALGGKMDFPGMMAAYTQAFGTPTQPNKPARITVQVASLAGPGMLAEIEVQAAKPRK